MSETAPSTTVGGHHAPASGSTGVPYGLIAEFVEPHHVVVAARRAYAAGYRKMDAYTPFPVNGLAEAIGFRKNGVSRLVLACGLMGGFGALGMQWFASVIHYPLIIAGRPFASWPSFMPVTFEATILLSAFAAVFGMLALNGLPLPHHPIFNAPGFEQASQTKFFLCIEASDPKFDLHQTRSFLEGLGAGAVSVVER